MLSNAVMISDVQPGCWPALAFYGLWLSSGYGLWLWVKIEVYIHFHTFSCFVTQIYSKPRLALHYAGSGSAMHFQFGVIDSVIVMLYLTCIG